MDDKYGATPLPPDRQKQAASWPFKSSGSAKGAIKTGRAPQRDGAGAGMTSEAVGGGS